MALTLDEIQEIIETTPLEASKKSELLAKVRQADKDKADARKSGDEGEEKKGKYRNVVFIRGDEETKRRVEGGAWIAQIVEDPPEGSLSIKDGLIAAAARQNDALVTSKSGGKRGRPSKGQEIKSWFNLFAWIKPKWLKDATKNTVKIKTKSPAEVIVLDTEDVPFAQ